MDALLEKCSKPEQRMANLAALCRFLSTHTLKRREIKFLYEKTKLTCPSFLRKAGEINIKGGAMVSIRDFQRVALERRKKWMKHVGDYHDQIWKKMNGGKIKWQQ